MIQVITPARLHFGLFVPEPAPAPWLTATQASLPVRRFGGVGLMVRDPGLLVQAEPASTWTATGPQGERALRFAQRVAEMLHHVGPPLALTVVQAMPAHSGLGSGTQLGLAVAHVITTLWKQPATLADLARLSGRGLRSGLGLHGFSQGGFLIEAGKPSPDTQSLLLARHEFPSEWAILLIRPPGHQRIHGPAEQEAFTRLKGQTDVAALARLVLLGLLPALLERDLLTFGQVLHEFNRRAGEVFAPVQGGPYASPQLGELLADLRREGLEGIGQSSWGPTLFAIVEADRAPWYRDRLTARSLEVTVTHAANTGVTVREIDPSDSGST